MSCHDMLSNNKSIELQTPPRRFRSYRTFIGNVTVDLLDDNDIQNSGLDFEIEVRTSTLLDLSFRPSVMGQWTLNTAPSGASLCDMKVIHSKVTPIKILVGPFFTFCRHQQFALSTLYPKSNSFTWMLHIPV